MRLSARQLNRATLARQLLLRRERLDPVAAIERLAGLQAQEPASPHIALWTRVQGFRSEQLTLAVHARELVKATLGRSTLHIVSAADYRASATATLAVTRSKWMNEARGRPVERGLPELAGLSLAFARLPRTNVELRDHAGTLGEPVPADELWRRIRRYGTFVHVPTDDPWSYGRRPLHIAADAWTGEPQPDRAAALEHLVRRYLLAFGPARTADMAQWSGLAVRDLRIGLGRIEELVTYEDPRGRELFDLPGAPLPDGDTPAPPRLLPMWDETLLAYAERDRVLPERYRQRVIVKGGDVLPTFTLDGYVAGLWWAEAGEDGASRIVFEPFETLGPDDRTALGQEGAGLAALVGGREPDVYRRYRYSRRRDRSS